MVGTRLARGHVIADKYTVVRPLAEAPGQALYVAENRAVGKPCTVALLAEEHCGEAAAFLERHRAAHGVAAHPHVAEVFDSGVADGQPFFAMEALDGSTLANYVTAQGPLSQGDVSRFVAQLAAALDHLHGHDTQHGGLDDGCVLIVRDSGGTPSVKLVGVGVRAASSAPPASTYLAPEQLAGPPDTPAADIFALALLAYQLFTGHDAMQLYGALTPSDAAAKIDSPTRPRPSAQAGLAALRLPHGFDDWFARANAHDPSQRFASAGEAATFLSQLVAGAASPTQLGDSHPVAGFHARTTAQASHAVVVAQTGAAATAPTAHDVTAVSPGAPHAAPSPTDVTAVSPGAQVPNGPAQLPPTGPPMGPPSRPPVGAPTDLPMGPPPHHPPHHGMFPHAQPLPPRSSSSGALIAIAVAALFVVALGGGIAAYLLNAPGPVAVSDDASSRKAEDDDDKTKTRRGRVPASHGSAAVPVTSADPSWGDVDAPVTLVVFSDLQCPFCKRLEATLAELRQHYGKDELRIVWKDFPLPFHARAERAAQYGEAVFQLGGQAAFWRYQEQVFAQQDSLDEQRLEQFAKQAGVRVSALHDQLDGAARSVTADVTLGKELGVKGTPQTFINGKRLSGAQARDRFEEIIDEQLREARALVASGTERAEIYPRLTNRNYAPEAAAPSPTTAKPEDDPTIVWKVPVSPDDPQRGPRDALVTVVIFSDFQCPFCGRVTATLDKVMADYDEVRLVWKDHPLPFHKRADPAAQAAREVRAQKGDDAFWKMHDTMFANQKALEDADLVRYAADLGANGSEVRRAIADRRHADAIQAGTDLSAELSAAGTPTFFINGKRLRGAQPYDKFAELIDERLAEAKRLVAAGTARGDVYAETIAGGRGAPAPSRKSAGPIPADAPTRGPTSALITIQVFSDFQCPFCNRVTPTLEAILKDHGDVKLVFRHNPLPFHKDAPLAHQAAIEAQAQKGDAGFWDMHDRLFANQKRLGRADLEDHAREMGLDMAQFKRALDTGKHQARIDADIDAARAAGIRGTPMFLIDDLELSGAQPQSAFDKLIRDARAGVGPL